MREPKISIILPSYLGEYKRAAKDRPTKLRRAIESVLSQTYHDWELIVISDGCDLTTSIATEMLPGYQAKLIQIPKQPMFSGTPRNFGIEASSGEWICYLDSDDMFGENHLDIIVKNVGDLDWYYFNDMIYKGGKFVERESHLSLYKCGTSNITHRKSKARWEHDNTYGTDDWLFVSRLKNSGYGIKIETPEYLVCHIPQMFDV